MSQDIEELIAEKKKLVESMFYREEFYDDPQKVFTDFANTLPSPKLVWQVAFWTLFGRGNLVEVKLRNQESE